MLSRHLFIKICVCYSNFLYFYLMLCWFLRLKSHRKFKSQHQQQSGSSWHWYFSSHSYCICCKKTKKNKQTTKQNKKLEHWGICFVLKNKFNLIKTSSNSVTNYEDVKPTFDWSQISTEWNVKLKHNHQKHPDKSYSFTSF